MDSSAPFYQQLNTRLIVAFLFVLLLFSFLFSLFSYRDQQVNGVVEKQIPEIENLFKQQKLYGELNQLINLILNSQSSKLLVEEHRRYIDLLTQLKGLSQQKKADIEGYISAASNQLNSITRLSENHQRNQLLLQNSVIQLQLVLSEINTQLADKTTKQQTLFKQITEDSVADSVTASRAKAHANLFQSMVHLKEMKRSVDSLYLLLSQLNLQSNLANLTAMASELTEHLSRWQLQIENLETASDIEKPLLMVLAELQKLLITEQNVIAKWRGHIRVAGEYFQLLSTHQAQLTSMAAQLHLPKQTYQLLPDFFKKLPAEQNAFIRNNLSLMVLIISLFMVLVVWVLFVKVKQRVKEKSQTTLALVESTLLGKDTLNQNKLTVEDEAIVELLRGIEQSSHDEFEFGRLKNQINKIQSSVYSHAQAACYQLTKQGEIFDNQFALNLLSEVEEPKLLHWRQAFERQTVKTILISAKEAKLNGTAVQCDVLTRTNKALSLTIIYQDETWYGVICAQDKIQALVNRINKLEQNISNQSKDNQLSFAHKTDKLSKMLIRTMLQSQSVSIGSGITSLQVYRQLTRIFDWCRQLQITTELTNDEHITTLNNVVLRNELYAFCQNAMVEANQQRNRIFLKLDSHLLHSAKINIRLFHRTLLSLVRLCLLEQYKSILIINADVADKNSGQQMIRFTFDVHVKSTLQTLPEIIQALTVFDGEDQGMPQVVNYLFSLLKATFSQNIQASLTERGFQLSVEMPIAQSEDDLQSIVALEQVNLKEQHFVLLSSTGSPITQLQHTIESANGKVECFESAEHFVKQATIKSLTSHPVSVVIISASIYQENHHFIEQHINGLPSLLQPKIMVLQASFNTSLHQAGFFEQSESPCEPTSFVQSLAKMTKQVQKNNSLVPAEVFAKHRFSSTQVEVLLAVNEPEKYQQLSRLLHWLGLQVYVVCQSQGMLKHWQTGRYLVLLTEFDVEPFVELEVGKNVSRGVFSLGQCKLDKPADLFENWLTGQVQDVLDIDNLVKLLTPWLKENQRPVSSKPVTSRDKVTVNCEQTSKVKTKAKSSNEVLDDVNSNKTLTVAEKESLLPQAFDLAQFAKNQGSAELAVFMLDDYLLELGEAVNLLQVATKNKRFNEALEHNAEIEKVSTIIAADELIACSKDLNEALNKKAIRNSNAKIKQLNQQYQNLIEFAQAL